MGSGALSTRISIILTKSFHIIHTKAQSPDIGSGVCQYSIQGQIPFLPEPGSVYENVFALYIPRAQSPDIGFPACQHHIQGLMPLLLKPHILLTKTSSHYTTRAQSLDIWNLMPCQMPFFTRISYSANAKLFTIYIQGLRALRLCSSTYQRA